LTLDHISTHKHFHLHPTVLRSLLEIGRGYGMQLMRLPFELGAPLWMKLWISMVRARMSHEGIVHNAYVVGIARSGNMNEAALLAAVKALPHGLVEIYCHPAIEGDRPLSDGMQFYRHADELQALMSAIGAAAVRVGGLSDLLLTPL
jgi:predicted glycoside hydrolase/deacetylase ChbG (UPF0249 family)